MMRINLGWCGTLIMGAMIMVSMQCLSQETYQQAMLKCSKLPVSQRNLCRMDATNRYRNINPEITDERFYMPPVKRHVHGEIIDFKEIFNGYEEK